MHLFIQLFAYIHIFIFLPVGQFIESHKHLILYFICVEIMLEDCYCNNFNGYSATDRFRGKSKKEGKSF